MDILVGAASDIGNKKKTNEDSFIVNIGRVRQRDIGLFVVCDGMGGLAKGEIASSTAVKAFRQWFDYELKALVDNEVSEEVILKSLVDTVKKANAEIIAYGAQISERVGTTASALLILFDKYYIVHVGDSRIYKMRKDIEQLTEDHTYVAMSVKNNTMTKEEAKVHPRRNVLTQCVGVKENIDVYTRVGKLNDDERFVLCSDGLYNKVSDNEILKDVNNEKTFDNESLQKVAVGLVNKAKYRGETDNITAIVLGLAKEERGFRSKISKIFKL